jgi:tetratricopeptide (TPR) repeat protein
VYILQKNFKAMAAAAILTAAIAGAPGWALAQGAAQPAAQAAKPAAPQRQMLQPEYDAYNAAQVDLGKGDFTKALADLDAWRQKFPKSAYANDGKAAYVFAYAGAKQPAKAVDLAGELLSGDIDSLFPDPKGGPLVVVRVLFTVSQAITLVPVPTADEAATAQKAADLLLKYSRKAEGYSDDQWKQLHGQVDPLAKQAIYYITVAPGVDALQKKDFATAEAAFRKALQSFPDNAAVAAYLGAALVGQYKTNPEKFPEALYMYARAASVDPTAGSVTKEWQTTGPGNPTKSLTSYYTQFHGSADGLDDLKALAVKSPTPPAGFTVKSSAEVEKDKHDAFVAAHPDLARWLEVKKALTDGGDAYFKDNVAEAAMPKLKGKVLDGKPACNSKQLIVALSDDTTPEVTLILDTPVKGKPTAGVDITWEGAIAKSFTATPFNLSMEMEQAKIEGLEKKACVPTPPVRRTPAPAAKKQ